MCETAWPPASVRILAPDARRLDREELVALGSARVSGRGRSAVLDRCRHMVALAGDVVAGMAAFELELGELRAYELVVEPPNDEVLTELVTALELACLAAGGHRIFISAHASIGSGALARFGYEPAGERWLEKGVA
ncbi:MAG: hypothetical protein AB7H88_12785 [Vicinamibacterales bacterium]